MLGRVPKCFVKNERKILQWSKCAMFSMSDLFNCDKQTKLKQFLERIQVAFDNCFSSSSTTDENWMAGNQSKSEERGGVLERKLNYDCGSNNGWMLAKPGISRATMHFRTPDAFLFLLVN